MFTNNLNKFGDADYNVLVNKHLRGDEETLFFDGEVVNKVPAETTLLDIVVAAGVFPSKAQARRCGWVREIPDGFSRFERIGKRRVNITIFKPTKDNIK